MEISTDIRKYVALLRGINISGRNKVPMSALKESFEEIGFLDVKTHLNSGNVIFSSGENDINRLVDAIEAMLKERFGYDIPVFVISQEELADVLQNAPDWWGDDSGEIYDNLIFIMYPATFGEVYKAIGEPKAEYEKIQNFQQAVFWSFSRKEYQKTNWWPKTASVAIRDKITIRTANTVRKLATM